MEQKKTAYALCNKVSVARIFGDSGQCALSKISGRLVTEANIS
jgi:hypothetical protein